MDAQRARVVAVVVAFGALFAIVAVRATALTVLNGQRLARLARQQHHERVALPAVRGPIVDRHGEALALTVDAESLYLRPGAFRGDEDKIGSLAAAVRLPVGEVRRKAAAPARFVWLKRLAAPREVEAAAAVGARGVGTLPESRRVYPRGTLAAHVLGFVNVDAKGLEGVERFYDHLVNAEPRVIETDRDALGRGMLTTGAAATAAALGARVELTIDATLQDVAERAVAEGVAAARAVAGTAVVLDPWTGEVLALANAPAFDPNNVGRAPAAARRNRAITDSYEPGSTFKAILAAAALDQRVVGARESVFCENGRYRVGGRVIHDHSPHGWLSLGEVMQYSSNIGASKVAERLGRDRLHEYLRAFGFGEPTGIDLPGEVGGRVRPRERWSRIDLATASFGQGVAVTPLQLARAFAAIANGGLLLRPFVVRRIVGPDGDVLLERTPAVVRRVVRPETARAVAGFLRRVVEEKGGTGERARLAGYAVAGKTGTSQKVDPRTRAYSPTARVASFVGFVPAEAPRLVILVAIDEPRTSSYGGVVAAPVFQSIAAASLARLGVQSEGQGPFQEVHGGEAVVWRSTSWNGGRAVPGMAGSAPRGSRRAWDHGSRGVADGEDGGLVVLGHRRPGVPAASGRLLLLALHPGVTATR